MDTQISQAAARRVLEKIKLRLTREVTVTRADADNVTLDIVPRIDDEAAALVEIEAELQASRRDTAGAAEITQHIMELFRERSPKPTLELKALPNGSYIIDTAQAIPFGLRHALQLYLQELAAVHKSTVLIAQLRHAKDAYRSVEIDDETVLEAIREWEHRILGCGFPPCIVPKTREIWRIVLAGAVRRWLKGDVATLLNIDAAPRETAGDCPGHIGACVC